MDKTVSILFVHYVQSGLSASVVNFRLVEVLEIRAGFRAYKSMFLLT